MVKEVPLSRGMVSLVDDEDFDSVMRFKWFVAKSPRRHKDAVFYAVRELPYYKDGKRLKHIQFLHRFLLGVTEDIDHRDGDGLNNQRLNLRPTTGSLNQANRKHRNPGVSSVFRGVSWNRHLKRWRAQVTVNRRCMWLGAFDDEVDAARAYDAAALIYFGEFASLNFPSP